MSLLDLATAALTRGRRRATERFWSAALEGRGITTWLHEPIVRRYVNASVTGNAGTWPMERLAAETPEPIARAWSLACGDGAIERDLRRTTGLSRRKGRCWTTASPRSTQSSSPAPRNNTARDRYGRIRRPLEWKQEANESRKQA